MSDAPESRLALSTCWNSSRHTDGYEMLEEIREMGFPSVELSHGIPVYLVEGIQKAVAENWIQISSVHNFCPLPPMARGAAPNLFQPSAKNSLEKRSWLRYSCQTLDFAKQVGARHVVMHSGSTSFRFRSPHPILMDLGDGTEKAREKALGRLKKRARSVQSRIVKQYEALLPYAADAGLVLVIENREGILEMPLDCDMADFLDAFPDAPIAYWHDTGHAGIKEKQGLLDHNKHLESLADRLAGFHLHDVADSGRDHQPIGSGSLDFRMIASHIRPHHTLVLELSPRLSREQVLSSRKSLLDLLS